MTVPIFAPAPTDKLAGAQDSSPAISAAKAAMPGQAPTAAVKGTTSQAAGSPAGATKTRAGQKRLSEGDAHAGSAQTGGPASKPPPKRRKGSTGNPNLEKKPVAEQPDPHPAADPASTEADQAPGVSQPDKASVADRVTAVVRAAKDALASPDAGVQTEAAATPPSGATPQAAPWQQQAATQASSAQPAASAPAVAAPATASITLPSPQPPQERRTHPTAINNSPAPMQMATNPLSTPRQLSGPAAGSSAPSSSTVLPSLPILPPRPQIAHPQAVGTPLPVGRGVRPVSATITTGNVTGMVPQKLARAPASNVTTLGRHLSAPGTAPRITASPGHVQMSQQTVRMQQQMQPAAHAAVRPPAGQMRQV